MRDSVTLGVIGAGQLARMMISPAVELGITLQVLAEEPGMAASLVASQCGDYRDRDTVLAFARGVDAVTFDHEHVPQPVLHALVAEGIPVHPGQAALAHAQDKLLMRAGLERLGIPQPVWAEVTSADEIEALLAVHGGEVVVKTPRGGYDGKGVRLVHDGHGVDDWFVALAEDGNGGPLLVEEKVPFTRELAQQVARRPSGQVASYPLVETVQRDGVCAEVIAPAPGASPELAAEAERIAIAIAEGLEVTGMLAVELFETADGRLLVNELAMRPHNSGHWTQDGAVTSQFEQHLRAVLDLPLGQTRALDPWAVMVNIFGGPAEGALAAHYPQALANPAAKVHLYGKAPRPGRKLGHVTVTGTDLEAARVAARTAAASFQ